MSSGSDDTEIELENFKDKVRPLTKPNPIWPGQQVPVPVSKPDLEKNIDDLKNEYKELKKEALTNAGKAIIADRIAKGVPVITKGTLTAITAFEKNDFMACYAALMDICSGAAVLYPPPAGPIVGAFFNTIGQILNFFVVQEPPLEDKIEKLLEHFQSEQQKENVSAIGHSIKSYATSLRTKSMGTKDHKGIADILAMPLTSGTEAGKFKEMTELQWGLTGDRNTLIVPAFKNWLVAGYLENPDNWRKEGWPEVLGIWCQTYMDLRIANVMLNCLADPKTLDRLINITSEEDKQSLPKLSSESPMAKQDCHKALINLQALVGMLSRSWESDKQEMLRILEKIRPAAKERGLYAHVGYRSPGLPGNILYTVSGTGIKDALKWSYKDNADLLNSISIHTDPTDAEKKSFTPNYVVFTCDIHNRIGRHILDSVKNTLSDNTVVPLSIDGMIVRTVIPPRSGVKFLDASAMAPLKLKSGWRGSDSTKLPKAYVTLLIENNKNYYVNLYVIDEDNKSTRISWEASVAVGAKNVRSLYLPPTTLPDDPDADALVDKKWADHPLGPLLLAQRSDVFLTYVGVRDANKIQVVRPPHIYDVEGPDHWTSYNGIEVDPYYLWVFGKGGIACATHASIIKCCHSGKIERPSWFYHDFDTTKKDNKEYFIIDKELFPDTSPPKVTSLCPCVDGTLVTDIQDNIYTADYQLVPKLEGLNRIVTSSWVKRGGKAKQVIKMPIPCRGMDIFIALSKPSLTSDSPK